MATYDEIFAGYEQPNINRNRWNRYADKVFAGYEPTEQSEDSLSANALNLLKTIPLTVGAIPLTAGGIFNEYLGKGADALADMQPENSWRRGFMEGLRDAYNSSADLTTDALRAMAPSPIPGWTSTHASGLLGALGGLASMLQSDRVADSLIEESENLAPREHVPAELSWEYFTNPNGLRSDLGQLTGSMAAIAPFSLAAGYAGLPAAIEAGLTGLGGNALRSFILRQGMKNGYERIAAIEAAKRGLANAATYGLTSAPIEGAMEGGHTRREALAEGLSNEEATSRAQAVMLANIPTLLATNTLEGVTLFAPRLTRLFKGAKGSKLGTAAEIAGRATLNSLQEQTEEALQQGIQDWAMGRDYGVLPWNWTDAQWEAASRVKYPAALIGGAGGIYHSVRKPNDTTPNPEAVPPKGNVDTNATIDSTQSNPEPDTENTIDVEAEVLPTQQQETTTPIDINAEDNTTQKLFEQFAEERRRSSQDATEVDFFDGMFTDKDKFINSKENRNAIRERYGEEMTAWANSLQQEQKPAQNSQQSDEYLNNAPVIESGRKFLEQLRAQGKNAELSLRLQSAIQSGNTSEVENILKQNNIAISSQQNQQTAQPVQNNTTPENVLETSQPVQSDRFKMATVYHPDLGERFSAKGTVPYKIFDDVKALAKKHGGFKDNAYGKGYLFETSEQRDTFVKEADELINSMPQKETVQPQIQETSAPVQAQEQPVTPQQTPQPKRTTPTDLEPKILEIIPSDKFITDDEILMQVDDVEPWELPDIMLSLQMKGQVEENAGRYKRNSTLQNQEQTLQPQEQVTTPQEAPAPQSTLQNQQQTLQEQPQPQPAQAQPQSTKQKKQSKRNKKAELHAKLKTDTHPLIKAYLENLFKTVGSKEYSIERHMALNELEKLYNTKEITDEMLDKVEADLKQRQEKESEERRRIKKQSARDKQKQTTEESISAPESKSRTEIFKRNGTDATEIEAGRKAIKNAPDGTKILAKYIGLGVNAEEHYIITNGKFQSINADGQRTGNALKLSNENIRKYFGQRSLQEIELTYPEESFAQQEEQSNGTSQTPQTEKSSGNSKNKNQDAQPRQAPQKEVTAESKLAATLHAKFGRAIEELKTKTKSELEKILEADKYPSIQKYLDDRFKNLVYDTLEDAEKNFGRILETVRKWKAEHDVAKFAAEQMLTQWEDSRPRTKMRGGVANAGNFSNPTDKEIDKKAFNIIRKMRDGKITAEQALEKLDELLSGRAQEKIDAQRDKIRNEKDNIVQKTKEQLSEILDLDNHPALKEFMFNKIDQAANMSPVNSNKKFKELCERTIEVAKRAHDNGRLDELEEQAKTRPLKKTDTSQKDESQSKPSKPPTREEANSNESISAMNAALRESSEKIINDAAKNSDVARALEQLGAKIKNGKVNYPDDETFQRCVNLVNSGIVKSSKRGNTDTTIKNFVAPEDLNPLQKAYGDFAKEISVPIVFFRGNKNFHGAHANGISFYNVDAIFSHEFVYWHEFGHWLKNNQPQLFQEMLDAADITKAQLDEKRNSRPELTDDELKEEIICDAMSDVARRTGLLNQIGKKNSSLIQRIISWAKTTLDRFTDWFNRKEFGLTNAQRDRMKDVFGKGVRQITDGNGNKIFRYNNRTHEIELVDGRKLPTVQNSAKPKYSIDAETKKAATEGELELPEGYRTESGNPLNESDAYEFIVDENGNRDIGKISKEIEQKTDGIVEAASVRLQVGLPDIQEQDGFGYIHIMEHINDIKSKSFNDIISYVKHILKNFNQIYQAKDKDTRIILYCKGEQSKGFMPLDLILEKDDNNYYRVVTAYPRRRANKNEKLLFDEHPTNSSTAAATVPRTLDNNNKSGVASTRDNGKSNFSDKTISQEERDSKPNTASDEEYLQAVDDFKNAKTDEQRRSTFRKLQDMVQRAAEAAGFTNAIPEQTVAYKVRTGAAPKKTVKVYKVFTVANDGSPTALFVGGTEKLPQGVWLDAQDAYHFKAKNGKYYVPSTQNPFTKGGKTGASVEIPDEATRQELIKRGFLPEGSKATKITALAYRPGWHAGTLPFFPQGGVKPKSGTTSAYPNIHRYNQVVFECELAAEKNFTAEAEAQPKARTKDGKLNTREADLQYMPENGFYYYATNPMTHGHPELGMWAISGSLKINRALTQEECDKILADNNMAPQEWEQGKMNLADLGYTGEQNDAARKTVAPITYDDNGEVIPLSQRFDASRNDIRYSLDASDNGNESFVQRVRNKISSLFDNSSPSMRRDKKITKLLSKLSGYRIAFGHLAKDSSDVFVDDLQKIIRSNHAYEWEKILPVVGKKIASNLKLDATPEMSNYIADWILTGALNNTSAEATAFAKAARDNPAMFELLDAVRDTFKEISDMTPLERVKSKIVSEQKKTFLQRLGFKGGLREEFVDDLRPIENMVERAIKESSPEVAKLIKESIDPYKAARLLRGKGGVADIMLYGTAKDLPKIRAALQEQYPNVKFEYLKTMEMIIDEAGGKKNLADFEAFCLAKLTKEIHEHNRDNPNKKITTTFSEEDCDTIIKDGEEKFATAQQDLVRFSKTLLSMQYDAGLLTQKQYSKIIKKWKAYVPMARVFDENEDYDFYDSLQERTGSKRDIYSPIQKVIANTERFVRQAERNKAKLEIATLARFGGLGGIIAEVESAKPNVDNIIYFKENGKLKKLETPDVSIARAVNSLQKPSDAVWFTKVFKGIMAFMRAAYTSSNLDFVAGNIFRDSADAFIHNKYSGANPLTAMLSLWRRGLLGVIRRDADYYDWIANGGSQTSFVSEDVDYSQRAISDLTRGTRKERYLSKHFFSQVLDDIQKLAEYSEYATRLNTYKTAKDKLSAQRGAKATVTDKRLAALESREASIDFAKAGRSMRVVNQILLFSNAAVQGLALDFKTFNPNKFKTVQGRKELFAAAFRMFMASVVPAALIFALNHSDDDRRKKYKNRPDWEKDTYWIFGDGFRIPKGMDLGIKLFSTLTDEFLGLVADNDPIETKRIAKAIMDAAPSITATLITPAFEAYANFSIFRDAPIVPFREQKLPAHLQYDSGTSPVAKKVGELIDYSPRKIDYLISGYLGFMGRFFSGGTDELPIVRRFIFDPYKNPKVVKEYYEALDEQTKLFNDYKQTKKAPDGYDAKLYGRLKSAQKSMQQLSKLERKILEDEKLSADQRTAKLRELEQRRVVLCEKVFKRAR